MAQDSLSGGAEADVLDGGAGADTLDGGAGQDHLQGGIGNDLLRGGGGAGDQLRGGDGADTLDAASGDGLASLLLGGTGDDLYLVDSRADAVVEQAGGGRDRIVAVLAGGGYLLPPQVEDLDLAGTAASGTGNALGNRITGNGLANLLRGEAGADTLDGGAGTDTLTGGSGADVFLLGDGTDTLTDFHPGEDRLAIPATAFASAELVLAALTAGAVGTTLVLPGGGVVLLGLTPAQLHAADIVLF